MAWPKTTRGKLESLKKCLTTGDSFSDARRKVRAREFEEYVGRRLRATYGVHNVRGHVVSRSTQKRVDWLVELRTPRR